VTFPLFFAPEIFTGATIPLLAGSYFAAAGQHSTIAILTFLALVWYGAEWALAKSKGWHVSWRYPIVCFMRDCLIPAVWAYAWIGKKVVWRGNAMTIQVNGAEPLRESSFFS
jgi:ceramide glucosyltransferase